MKNKVRFNRRTFLAANAAATVVATVPITASATSSSVTATSKPLGWHNVTADDLAHLVGERFRVRSNTVGEIAMKLIAVEPVSSGEARPSNLPRAEGVVAVFDSPDKTPLVACDHSIHRVSHPRLGSADLFFGASCLRNGGHVIEMVLN